MDLWFTCIWLVQVFCIHTCCYVLYCAKDCLSAVSECLLIPPMEISQKIDLVPFEKHKTRCTFKMNCKTKLDSNFRNLQNIRRFQPCTIDVNFIYIFVTAPWSLLPTFLLLSFPLWYVFIWYWLGLRGLRNRRLCLYISLISPSVLRLNSRLCHMRVRNIYRYT
jgi:hypothetical protein